MKFFLTAAAAAGFLFSASPLALQALANEGPGPRQKLEVYPAIEENAVPGYVETPVPTDLVFDENQELIIRPPAPAAPGKLRGRVEKKKSAAKEKAPEMAEELASMESDTVVDEAADTAREAEAGVEAARVPGKEIPSISRRLKLVDLILRRHGLAFDYRTLTTPQLEQIIRELEGAGAPQSN